MSKKSKEIEKLERELARCIKKHDKIVNPICYSGNCPICNQMKDIDNKIKLLKEKK